VALVVFFNHDKFLFTANGLDGLAKPKGEAQLVLKEFTGMQQKSLFTGRFGGAIRVGQKFLGIFWMRIIK
jgi:hypothetical protein